MAEDDTIPRFCAEGTYGTITQEEFSILMVTATTANVDGNYTNSYCWVPNRQLVSSSNWELDYIYYIADGCDATGTGLPTDNFQS